jgi:hypothetical protein
MRNKIYRHKKAGKDITIKILNTEATTKPKAKQAKSRKDKAEKKKAKEDKKKTT